MLRALLVGVLAAETAAAAALVFATAEQTVDGRRTLLAHANSVVKQYAASDRFDGAKVQLVRNDMRLLRLSVVEGWSTEEHARALGNVLRFVAGEHALSAGEAVLSGLGAAERFAVSAYDQARAFFAEALADAPLPRG